MLIVYIQEAVKAFAIFSSLAIIFLVLRITFGG